MLTAINKNGKIISLINIPADLIQRNKAKFDEYYCPICKEPLILKAGTVRIPHFSHKHHSDCISTSSEPESFRHLQGKTHLYEFFKKLGLYVKLEYYIPLIQQRADLFVKHDGQKYAIEFQCSPLSHQRFKERANGYREAGIMSIWIIGGLPYKQKRNENLILSDFHWSMIKERKGYGLSILSYQPENKYLHLLANIRYVTSKKVNATLSSIHINQIHLPIQFPIKQSYFSYLSWHNEKKRWLQNKVRYGNLVSDSFLSTIYSSHHSPFLLPSICGIPVRYMEFFQSHPMEWQYFIYKDCLMKLRIGQRISLKYIKQKLLNRIKSRSILLRAFGLETDANWEQAVTEYFYLLTELEYFSRKSKDLFEMRQKIVVPNSVDEALKLEKEMSAKLNKLIQSTFKINDHGCVFFNTEAGFNQNEIE